MTAGSRKLSTIPVRLCWSWLLSRSPAEGQPRHIMMMMNMMTMVRMVRMMTKVVNMIMMMMMIMMMAVTQELDGGPV